MSVAHVIYCGRAPWRYANGKQRPGNSKQSKGPAGIQNIYLKSLLFEGDNL